MKNQDIEHVQTVGEKSPVPPAFTRALRGAVRSNKLENLLFSTGATKLRGTPTEVLEEVAVAQTAAWIGGKVAPPVGATPVRAPPANVRAAAAESIDDEALVAAAELVGVYGSSELESIRTHLTMSLAVTAYEANRFAAAEARPLCHNCVAIGGVAAARTVSGPAFAPRPIGGR